MTPTVERTVLASDIKVWAAEEPKYTPSIDDLYVALYNERYSAQSDVFAKFKRGGNVYGKKPSMDYPHSSIWLEGDKVIAKVAEVLNEQHIPVKSFRVAPFDKPDKANAPQYIVDDPEKLKQWKADQYETHRIYHQQTKKAYRTRQVLSMAKEFQFKTYFLSWSLYWRGRFYSQQSWLTPLSTDFEKSLMKFRDGCKLNAEALDWCKSALGAAYKKVLTLNNPDSGFI